ncbi:putative membrane protein [Bhargavaea cecembensis DSE10]|uniref:Putative membrane protein n=1 Tax=Bhargavaea cecembensis DSE10 TaxID=1235279 RepID=M7NI14_9BACL|nr:membrane protein [Bhargavaea cecembensis]EMR06887.1 putative membrane protein [Bhargavaea cecembensis DSE10]
MKESIRLGAAFAGVVVGAGFASGQEILQFFTSFGLWGVAGGIAAMAVFAFIGMNLASIGSSLKSKSHKEIIYKICGKPIGMFVDAVITFFLFGVAVIMYAGAGSLFEEQFGIPAVVGSLFMVVATMVTVLLNVQKIITVIGAVTPFLVAMIILLAGYSVMTADISGAEIARLAQEQDAAAPHWLLSAFLYVSFNIACSASMLAVMGGTVKDRKTAALGGAIGGGLLGVLILLVNVAMLTKLDAVGGAAMPTLALAAEISPILANIMAVVLLCMIYNTAVGMLYSFTARVSEAGTKRFKALVVLFGIGGFALSFVGFVSLVGTLYPITGYLGLVLIAAVVIYWVRKVALGARVGSETVS